MATEFDAEMSEYLSHKRKEPLASTLFRKVSPQKQVKEEPEEMQEEHETAPLNEPVSNNAGNAIVNEKSWWARLWQPDEEEETPLANGVATVPLDDFKHVAKISLGIMKRLPNEELARLKTSEEFTQFKDILRRHSVIK